MDEQSAASSQADDEIDLKELFLHLWEGKFLIALCAVVSISLGSLYLHNATRLYTMQALVMPVESDSKVPNLGGLSNLAGLAG
ncbi:MAG: Wzz/FepE/Etk N-terminal domain-containing protein, partial [Alphaproteobacteria bacterium]